MPRLAPVSRRELVERLQTLGFTGPYTGGNHEFMVRKNQGLSCRTIIVVVSVSICLLV